MRGIQLSVMVRIVSVAALIHLAGAADVARAASATWDGPGGTGGDSNWNDSANWSGGVVPDNGAFTYDVFVDGGKLANSVVRINAFTPTVDNLTINVGDRVDINNGNSLTVVDTGTILNDGVIDLHSTGTGTALLINGSVAMTGSGVVEIGNGTHFNNLNVIEGADSSANRLTNIGNTIQGYGRFGDGTLLLTNHATIAANDPNFTLTFDLDNEAESFNLGTLKATNGATLWITGVPDLNNSSGTILAEGAGSTVLISSSTIKTGTLDTTGGGVIEGGAAVVLDGTVLLGGVVNNGTYHVTDNTATTLLGTIDNTNELALRSTGLTTRLLASGTVTLIGGGTVTLGDGATFNDLNVLEGVDGSGNKLVNTNNTIEGYGRLGDGTMALDNQHVISANTLGETLTIDLDVGEGQSINAGTLRAINGATLLITGTPDLNNSAGVIRADGAGSTVTIKGGTLTTTTGGVIEGSISVVLDGTSHGTLTNSGTYHVTDNTATTLLGTINNTNELALRSTGLTTRLLVSETVTLIGGGTVTLGDGVNINDLNVFEGFGSVGNKLVNVDNEIVGYGRVGDNTMELDNQSTITANNAGQQLTFDLDDGGGQNINAGTLRAINGATFAIQSTAADLNNSAGIIRADGAGSRVTLTSSTVKGGTLTTTGGGVIEGRFGAVLDGISQGTLTNSGTYHVTNGTSTVLLGTISNLNTFELQSTITTTQLLVSGTVNLTGGGTVTLGDGVNINDLNVFEGLGSVGNKLVNVDNEIVGYGRVGDNTMELDNQPIFPI